MSLAAVSKHLDVLERASLIRRERCGTSRMVRLNPKPLHAAQNWIAYYEQFWKTNLDRLQDLLETDNVEAPKRSVRKGKIDFNLRIHTRHRTPAAVSACSSIG